MSDTDTPLVPEKPGRVIKDATLVSYGPNIKPTEADMLAAMASGPPMVLLRVTPPEGAPEKNGMFYAAYAVGQKPVVVPTPEDVANLRGAGIPEVMATYAFWEAVK